MFDALKTNRNHNIVRLPYAEKILTAEVMSGTLHLPIITRQFRVYRAKNFADIGPSPNPATSICISNHLVQIWFWRSFNSQPAIVLVKYSCDLDIWNRLACRVVHYKYTKFRNVGKCRYSNCQYNGNGHMLDHY